MEVSGFSLANMMSAPYIVVYNDGGHANWKYADFSIMPAEITAKVLRFSRNRREKYPTYTFRVIPWSNKPLYICSWTGLHVAK
jgi:hypothetical protein